MSGHGFRRLLVANRGEIARRVLRAARARGLETVAVFAEDDREAPFVAEADYAVDLGPGGVALTYLNLEAIMTAVQRSGADALHPGYGFLSEDPRLAEAATSAGVIWVGPPAKAMATMGNKAVAKATVAAAGVPVLPGAVVDTEDPTALSALGQAVGYPLLVKAAAGGGGRGMRTVERPEALVEAVAGARRESVATFGSDEVFLERLAVSPRHIEVQVVADRHGNVVHLLDRECSVQRRHQKVLEEAPASFVAERTRRTMWQAALEAARAVGYEGAGTVEFIVSGEECAFLEMNTRLQVEHGVTELITGIDLVQLQLGIAAGEPLPFVQEEVAIGGHAIEARLCAERPREDYRPTPGTLTHARWPDGEGIRVDAAVESGSVVSPAYDSLVAKLMAHAEERPTAIARLERALRVELEFDGVETNRDLLVALLREEEFARGETTTDYLVRHPEVVQARLDDGVRARHAAAATLFLEALRAAASRVPGVPPGWRNIGQSTHSDRLVEGDEHLDVAIVRSRDGTEVVVDGPGAFSAAVRAQVEVASGSPSVGTVALEIAGVSIPHRVRVVGHQVSVNSAAGQSTFHRVEVGVDDLVAGAAGECRAPLPGSVAKVLVAVGDAVEDGTGLVVLEAMKMEHTLRASGPGIVDQVLAHPGQQVDVGQLLVVTEPVH